MSSRAAVEIFWTAATRQASRSMQLFILGPAFGLPSIDAECNATIALLQARASNEYKIIPTHDQSHRLPFLIDGSTQISGFRNIQRHLSNEGNFLDTKQRTDALAISSFVESNAPTLLDISLYVGFDNYRLATRPAFTKFFPWHANYIIPPQRRSAARTRTEYLGISSIDVDNVHEDMSNRPPGFDAVGKEPGFEAETQKRASLLLPKKDTLRSLLQRPEHSAVFKLHALADNFFEPLQDILGSGEFLLGTEEPASVDCLLYGYLALMLYPQLPQDWLASTLRRKYSKLAAYIERIHSRFGLASEVDQVLGLSANKGDARQTHKGMRLPWQAPATSTIVSTVEEIAIGIWNHLPLIDAPNRLRLLGSKSFTFFDRHLQTALLTTTASLAVMGYIAVRTGLFTLPHGDEIQFFGRKRLSDFGHLGASLAGLNLVGSPNGR